MKPGNKNLLGLVASLAVMVIAPLLGVTWTILRLRGAFAENATIAPSEKARALGEGISLAMNGTAVGLVVSSVTIVPAVVFAVRAYREWQRKRGD